VIVEAAMSDVDAVLWVQRTVENHSVVVHVSGELDLLTAPRLSTQLDLAEAIVVPPAPVVLDLTGLTFLGSAGLSVLIAHHRRCTELGSRLEIVPGGRAVTRPLAVTGLDQLLTIVPDFVGGRT
jgi:anti-sigma B factor antagonist